MTLRKSSTILKQSFIAMIQLSTQLIDVNWDKTIIESCLFASEPISPMTPGEEDLEGFIAREKQKRRLDLQRHEEIIEIVYERMLKKFVKELFKGCQKKENSASMWAHETEHARRKQKKLRH